MNDDFLRRTYTIVGAIWCVVCVLCLILHRLWVFANVTLGTAVCIVLLYSLQRMVNIYFIPGVKKPHRILFRLWALKFPMLFGILYLLVRWDKFNIAWFVAGVLLIYIAITIQAVGAVVAEGKTVRSFQGRN